MPKKFELHHGDCLDVLRAMENNSVDSIVTDPPYGLQFMGKKWDCDVPDTDIFAECLRVLKPGGHLLAFSGTRTQHRMAVRIEDAGFEIRDMIAWVYGQGFPKSMNIGKAIDKSMGEEREICGYQNNPAKSIYGGEKPKTLPKTLPKTKEAIQWDGWGTALKPSLEPITVARKPIVGTIKDNVLLNGTGGLNIDACRINTNGEKIERIGLLNDLRNGGFGTGVNKKRDDLGIVIRATPDEGRWPANLIHDGSEEVLAEFPFSDSGNPSVKKRKGSNGYSGNLNQDDAGVSVNYGGSGSAARFFYCAKANREDRDSWVNSTSSISGISALRDSGRVSIPKKNPHPTVKPTDLMRYLCRLVTPPGGVVLDPFMGSGSTGKAAMLEGFRFVGIEREQEYFEISRARIEETQIQGVLFDFHEKQDKVAA